ncbi:MAG: hypothetical protein LUQ59_05330 [Methanothrix sp.]|nr:hypothetical protein [Methanothrix sp.]
MHLAEAVGFVPQQPAPLHTDLLDLLQLVWVQEARFVRIVVEDAEDALAVTNRLPDFAQVEGRAVILLGMNLSQVIRERYDSVMI